MRLRSSLYIPLIVSSVAIALLLSTLAAAESDGKATIEPKELVSRLADGTAPLVLDVRSQKEFEAGHIPGAVLIPHDALADRIGELPEDKATEIVVHCKSGFRAGKAEEVLAKNGYTNVRDLVGHWIGWSEAGHPTE